jgi:putative endonuclease
MDDDAFRRGRAGEACAARHLEARGWTILARNWRDGPRELDLVARRGEVLAFVEVKTRGPDGWGHPLESLTRRKRSEVERAAKAWLGATSPPPGTSTIRFDAIIVWTGGSGAPSVEHLPDAWWPGWNGL